MEVSIFAQLAEGAFAIVSKSEVSDAFSYTSASSKQMGAGWSSGQRPGEARSIRASRADLFRSIHGGCCR
jgi:hypothetical protein